MKKEKTKKLCCANCKLRIRLSEKNSEEHRVVCPQCGVVIHLCKVFEG